MITIHKGIERRRETEIVAKDMCPSNSYMRPQARINLALLLKLSLEKALT